MFDPGPDQETESRGRGGSERATANVPVSTGRPGAPVDLARLAGTLRNGSRWILLCAIVGGLLGAVVARAFVKRKFASSATIVWEPSRDTEGSSDDGPRTLRTLVDSVKLPNNLAEVRRRLGREQTLEALGKAIEVEASGESHLVTVKTTSDSAEGAARLARVVVEAFLDHQLEIERARRHEVVRSLEHEVETADQWLGESRRAYDDFRRESGIADLPIETQVAIENAAHLRSEADAARAEAQSEDARQRALRNAQRTQHAVATLSENESRPDAVRFAESQAELASARARLAEDHPRVQALLAQTDALRSRASDPNNFVRVERTVGRNPQWEAIQSTLTTSSAQREAAVRRQAAYDELATQARSQLARLTAAEGHASELLSTVHTAETHLATLRASLARARDSAASAATGFRLVGTPLQSEKPAQSLRRIIAIASPVLSSILAVVIVLFRALRGLRGYTAREVAFWGNGPVIATSAWPADPLAEEDLVLDVRTVLRSARGRTLLAAAAAQEQKAVSALFQAGIATVSDGDDVSNRERNVVSRWDGDIASAAFRRAARGVDRVLFVVTSGAYGPGDLGRLKARAGRESGVGFVLIDLGTGLAETPDRVGDVDAFAGDFGTSRVATRARGGSQRIATHSGPTRDNEDMEAVTNE